MATQDNLQTAFAGESQANRMYLAFAKKAEADGLPQIAKLFRAAAAAETVHALAHFKAMGGIQDTVANLEKAAAGEKYEYTEMYPPFTEEAEGAGEKAALRSFRNAMEVEEVHWGLYEKALAAAKAGSDLPAESIWVCEICGNTVVGGAPDTCDVCGAGAAKFSEIA